MANPRAKQFPIELRTWLQSPAIALFASALPLVAQATTPNPLGKPFPTELRTFTQSTPLNLLGQDQIYGAPGEAPPYDYPNPRGKPFPQELRTWTAQTPLNLLGQDQVFGAAGEVPPFDYPNPRGKTFAQELRSFVGPSPVVLLTTANVVPATTSFDYPNPSIVSVRSRALIAIASQRLGGVPNITGPTPAPAPPDTSRSTIHLLTTEYRGRDQDMHAFARNVRENFQRLEYIDVGSMEVTTLNANGAAGMAGDLTLTAGFGITLTQNSLTKSIIIEADGTGSTRPFGPLLTIFALPTEAATYLYSGGLGLASCTLPAWGAAEGGQWMWFKESNGTAGIFTINGNSIDGAVSYVIPAVAYARVGLQFDGAVWHVMVES